MAKLNIGNLKKTVEKVADRKENIQSGNNLKTVSLSEIVKNEKNVLFRELTEKEMEELKASIQEVGLLEPLVVVQEGEQYKLISGHQRKIALEELGMDKVAVNIVNLQDEDEELALIHANIKQRKLNDMELARVIKAEKEIIQQKIKKGTLKNQGRAIEQVANNLEISKDKAKRLDRLNLLIPELQKLVEQGKITTGKAQEIGLLDVETQKILYSSLKENIEKFSLEEIKKIKQQDETKRLDLLKKLDEVRNERDEQMNNFQLQEHENRILKEKINELEKKKTSPANEEELKKLKTELKEKEREEKEQRKLQEEKERMLLQQIEKLRNDLTNTTKEESPIENYLKDKKIELTDDEKQVVNLLKEFSIEKQKSMISLIEKL